MPQVREILKRVKKIEVKTNKPVEGLISGSYRSVFKGRGIEFSEVREYVPGDDIRAIDWNVTARMNAPFVKEFIEERALNIYIMMDVSASNDFGLSKSKKESGYEIAASIIFSALRNNDNVGLCLFTDKVEKFVRPKKGRKHMLMVLRDMIYFEPKSRGTNIFSSLIYLSKVVRKRSIIFVISDFPNGGFEKPLKILKMRNDVILINMADAREMELPDIGYIYIEDEETGEQMVINTSDAHFRNSYQYAIKKNRDRLAREMKRIKIDMISVRTDEPFHIPIRKFFSMRDSRRMA
jgi:uncharacterized protein (DUF58 family)